MKKIVYGIIALGLLGAAVLASAFFYIASDLPSIEELQNKKTVESTKIYDRTGKVLLFEIHGEEKRTSIPDSQIPQFVKDAVVSVEDASFYTNPAFDWKGITRAIFVNITSGRALQGGSTITQQLAKNSFLTPERKIIRKLKELVLASRLEKHYTKNEILVLYLNQIPYGSNIYGIEAAAQTFFSKGAKDLTLGEAALLAALPKAPTYYSPWGSHKDELIKRKDFILEKMKEFSYINEEQFEKATSEKLKFAEPSRASIKAPHFVAYVQDYLNKKYGEDAIKTGGLRVTTTLDWEMEQIAEKTVKEGVQRNKDLYGGTNGALVAADPKTGQILAMVGSADYFDIENEGNFNVAAQGLRQPGSTFKPFAYLTAFQKGLTPDTIVWDSPTEFDTTGDEARSYRPENNDGLFRGPVTLKEALAHSLNIPSVKALYLAGVEDTIKTAEKFGITTLKDRSRFGLSLVLGGGEVKLVELVGAYGVFATEGVRNTITSILKIEDKDGNILEEYENQGEIVVEAQYPRLINDILSDLDLRSGLFRSGIYLTKVPGYQIALKTGTTNDYVDAWTVGYTPNIVVGVWAGNNHREPLKTRAGSVLAAIPIWHAFSSKVIPQYPPDTFTRPDPILSGNPILRGELVAGEPHDLLYHLGRVNESQSAAWEDGVREWLKTNLVDPTKFAVSEETAGTASSPKTLSKIKIDCPLPINGSFITDLYFSVDCSVSSSSPIEKIEVYFNNELVDTKVGELGLLYSYKQTLQPKSMSAQNLLVMRASDKSGLQEKKEIIIFR